MLTDRVQISFFLRVHLPVVVCPGSTPERQEAVWWTYSVTLDLPEYTVEDADGAVEVLELGLRSDLLGLMQCDNVTVGRKLASDYGIVGMDYLPDDIHEEGKKNSEVHNYLPVQLEPLLPLSNSSQHFPNFVAVRMSNQFILALFRLYWFDVHLPTRGCRRRCCRP